MRNPTDGAENGLSGEQGNVVNAFWSNVEPKEELWAQDDEDVSASRLLNEIARSRMIWSKGALLP